MGLTTHPMSERVRGSLFNIIGSILSDATVLDAFAGTGALGLEALSRGAKSATFVERDRAAFQCLTDNIRDLGLEPMAQAYFADVSRWMNRQATQQYDVIFTDPPYNDLQLSTVSRLVALLKPNGLMVLSYPGRGKVPAVNGIVVVDNRGYGNAALAFYQKK
jgi:16S rRNA (guanine966-N2)-methyltransferase